MILSLSVVGLASLKDDARLRFDNDGKFRIMVLADVQEKYPVHQELLAFITESIKIAKPNLIVFCGDNIISDNMDAYNQLLEPITQADIPFTLVFGNHDEECSGGKTKEELLRVYQGFDGCLAYDADPTLHGCATHNLPILTSDGSKVGFNLWLMDSGDYIRDDNGELIRNEKGGVSYDCVHKDQIEWYERTSKALQNENNGKPVYSLMFQHIIPQEATQRVFYGSPISLGDATRNFPDGTFTTLMPDVNKFSGYIFEKGGTSMRNDGQWASLVARGDVLGVVVGHDHVNSFIADVNGVDIIQTAGCTFNSYYDDMLQGCRIIELDEKNPDKYSTYNITTTQLHADGVSGLTGEKRSDFNYTATYYLSKVFEVIMLLYRGVMKLFDFRK